MPRNLTPQAARDMNALRETRAGGRPRSEAPRCPCGIMTLKRAEARGPSFEHDSSCSFYRERVIII